MEARPPLLELCVGMEKDRSSAKQVRTFSLMLSAMDSVNRFSVHPLSYPSYSLSGRSMSSAIIKVIRIIIRYSRRSTPMKKWTVLPT